MRLSQIIWDPSSLDMIISQLRNADELLMQCKNELQSVFDQGAELLPKDAGSSRQVLTALGHTMQWSKSLSDRSLSLLQSMRKVQDMILATEMSLANMMQEESVCGTQPDQSCCDTGKITDVFYTNSSDRIIGIVPQWLMDAANQAFL